MNVEIERRFLLKNQDWQSLATSCEYLSQGYLSVGKERTVRVRIANQRAFLTIKGFISAISRPEFEYEIPVSDAQELLKLCPFKVEKNRYRVPIGQFVYEIDEFLGDNAPLILAEIELPNENSDFPRPDWLGEEITFDERFSNAYLSQNPFHSWS